MTDSSLDIVHQTDDPEEEFDVDENRLAGLVRVAFLSTEYSNAEIRVSATS